MEGPRTIDALRAALAAHPGLELAIVFGSVATDEATPQSDVDVAVRAGQPLTPAQKIELIGDLALASGRAVDLVDLRCIGEPLLGQILAHGQRLLGSDEAYAELLHRHLIDAADFMPYVERILVQRRRAWIGK
jgi:predicted nucleotidyltransferase